MPAAVMQPAHATGASAASIVARRLPVMLSSSILILVGMRLESLESASWLIVSATTGSLCGSLAWFAIGHRLGRNGVAALVRGLGRYAGLASGDYRRVEGSYRHSRFATTLAGQALAGQRGYVGLAAGAARIGIATFLFAAIAGILIRTVPLVMIGAAAGSQPLSAGVMGLWSILSAIGIEGLLFMLLRPVGRGTGTHRMAS